MFKGAATFYTKPSRFFSWNRGITLDAQERWRIRQEKAKPIANKLHVWMLAQRLRVPDGSGTAKALDYSLKRWVALTRYLDDGQIPIDNNHIEQQIRPVAVGRKNWLFAGSLRAGKRAAGHTIKTNARNSGHSSMCVHRMLTDSCTT